MNAYPSLYLYKTKVLLFFSLIRKDEIIIIEDANENPDDMVFCTDIDRSRLVKCIHVHVLRATSASFDIGHWEYWLWSY